VLAELHATGAAISTEGAVRAEHGRDWWPMSIGWATRDVIGAMPAAVVCPSTIDQVAAVLRIAGRARISVTAAGGRSGVSGGSLPVDGGLVLDLTGLDAVIGVDEDSLTVTVEAGVFGPDLEAVLRATGPGYTLGHWPQSFELSTVGGWLACRGAGQYSTRYGKIEDMVRGLRLVLADGSELFTGGTGPRAAVGPDLTQLFVGSEGTLGIITQASLVVHPVPSGQAKGAWGFERFEDGMEVCRRTLRRGATPAVLRLYDEIEAERAFGIATNLLIALDEADPALVAATFAVLEQEASGGEPLDAALVERWLEHRNDVSQLVELWEAGIVVDTIEMSARWSVLAEARRRILHALSGIEGTLVASVHQSHAYLDGACLYFTFAGKPEEGPVGQEAYYRACFDAATSAIIDVGGSISHHHGIGMNRGRFMASALGGGLDVLDAIKGALDPRGILNPGKLGLGEGAVW
jgi:alkyldihydroxyacetonephosphate synthase